jgi:hypothetical protein
MFKADQFIIDDGGVDNIGIIKILYYSRVQLRNLFLFLPKYWEIYSDKIICANIVA